MKKFLYLLLILSFSIIHSQNILWVKRLDLSQNEYVSGVASDSSENIIIAGSAQNLSRTSSDVLIIKYNTFGDTLWLRQYDTVQVDDAIDLTTDPNDNIIVASYHYDLLTERPGLIKFSQNGELLWAKLYPALENYMLDGVASDSRSNIIACGHHWTHPQAVIIKCDTSGNPIWTRFYNWASSTEFWGIVLDTAENIIITGLLRYGPDSNALIVAKFNSSGDSIWTRDYTAGRWITHGTRIKLDNVGNIVVSGYDGDGHNSYDGLIFKYSPNGTMLWNRFLNFQAVDLPSGIAIDAHNNIFISGGCGNWDSLDYFLIKYSSSGETLWIRFYDAGFDDGCGGVVVDSQNNPIISGSSSNGANYDVLTIKYEGSSGIEDNSSFEAKTIVSELEIYPNPAKSFLAIRLPSSTDRQMIKIFDASGKLITFEYKDRSLQEHKQEVRISLKGMNPGIYFLRMGKETKKFLVVK